MLARRLPSGGAEGQGKAAFTAGGGGEGEAVLELWGVVDVAEIGRTQGFSARSCEACARGGEMGVGSSSW